MRTAIAIFWASTLLSLLVTGGCASNRPVDATAAFDIPRLNGINIDGNPADWAEEGFRVDRLAEMSGQLRTPADFDGSVRLGWDPRGLLVLIRVTDDVPLEADRDFNIWQMDSIELFLASRPGGPDLLQFLIAPGVDPNYPDVRYSVDDRRKDPALLAIKPGITAARTRIAHGYVLEALIPWQGLAITPALGQSAGFQVYINDNDGAGASRRCVWYPADHTNDDTKQMHALRLADAASPPVRVNAAAAYERFRRTRVAVSASPELLGKDVQVMEGGRTLGSGIIADTAGRPGANLILPMPEMARSYGPLSVNVGGQRLTDVQLPNLDERRRAEFHEAPIVFNKAVFEGTVFPPAEFVEPAHVEDLVGPYTITTTYYDAEYRVAATAARPGRYGAIVQVKSDSGESMTRYFTLFRQSGRIDRQRMSIIGELPKEMGIDAQVQKEQAGPIAAFLAESFTDELLRDPSTASVLAGLSEMRPGGGPAIGRNTSRSRDDAWWFGLKQKLGWPKLKYLTYLPQDYEQTPQKKWPLVLFLHGAGERGDDLERVKANGLARLIALGKQFPFIVISPQCPAEQWWSPYELNAFLDETIAKYNVDPDRIYVTGLSMGGFGSWDLACTFPERFAAVVPICGGGEPSDAPAIKDLPVWCFHGAKDNIVPIEASAGMVDALKKLGGRVRFTIYPEANHDSWTAAYATAELYDWLLNQRRGQPQEPPAATAGK